VATKYTQVVGPREESCIIIAKMGLAAEKEIQQKQNPTTSVKVTR